MNIRDKAKQYVPPPKINDIGIIPLDVPVYDDGEGIDIETGKTYKYSYMLFNDDEVRIPDSVISQLKEQILENPKMTAFKVSKKGLGKAARYTVVPIFE